MKEQSKIALALALIPPILSLALSCQKLDLSANIFELKAYTLIWFTPFVLAAIIYRILADTIYTNLARSWVMAFGTLGILTIAWVGGFSFAGHIHGEALVVFWVPTVFHAIALFIMAVYTVAQIAIRKFRERKAAPP